MITTRDVEWLAGFLEGEGSFVVQHQSSGCYSCVTAPQKQRWPLEKIEKIFGGNVSAKPFNGCYKWTAHGVLARGIAMTVYSLMSPRRQEQIRNMLAADTSTTMGSPEYHARMHIRAKKCMKGFVDHASRTPEERSARARHAATFYKTRLRADEVIAYA